MLFLYFVFVPICNSRPGSGGVGVGLWRRIPGGIHSFHKSLLSTSHAPVSVPGMGLWLSYHLSSANSSSHCRTTHIWDTNYMEVSGGTSGDVLPFVWVMNGCGRFIDCLLPTQHPFLFLFLLPGIQFCSVVYFPAGDSGEGSSDTLAPALISSRETIVRFSGSLGVTRSHY